MQNFALLSGSALALAFAIDLAGKLRRGEMDVGRTVCTDAEVIDWLRARVRSKAPELLRGVTIYPSTCSYCENRSRVYLRVRDDRGAFYDTRSLLYVLLHELAHVATDDDHGEYHGPDFQRTFAAILARFPEMQGGDVTAPDGYIDGCAVTR